MAAPAYVADYAALKKLGFEPTTRLVSKRLRPDGLVDVLFLIEPGYYGAWVSEPSSIWLFVGSVLVPRRMIDSADQLRELTECFPKEDLRPAP